jgi:hypothetical protein
MAAAAAAALTPALMAVPTALDMASLAAGTPEVLVVLACTWEA